jgi:hypothetical protein
MSTKPLMDISALISANNDLAEVPARVGGHPLTLTDDPAHPSLPFAWSDWKAWKSDSENSRVCLKRELV